MRVSTRNSQRKKSQAKGAWAERQASILLPGYEGLNHTRTSKGVYHPDGKWGTYLVSVKSTEGEGPPPLTKKEVQRHVFGAASETKDPLFILTWRGGPILVAITAAQFVALSGRDSPYFRPAPITDDGVAAIVARATPEPGPGGTAPTGLGIQVSSFPKVEI